MTRRSNIFAVVTKDGAPRAMFKPQAGKAYWDQQVARQAEGDDRQQLLADLQPPLQRRIPRDDQG